MPWWWRRRRRLPPVPVKSNGNGVAARRALVESRRALERDTQRVDEWTSEIRQLFGGQR